MVGRDAEQSGIIRSGAKLVNAVSNSIVPKITVVVGGSFGAGNYAHVRQGIRPALYSWPGRTARYAVMGAAQASRHCVFHSRPRPRTRRQESDARKNWRNLRAKVKAELRRANRHSLRRGARLDRYHHPTAPKRAMSSFSSSALCRATARERSLPHGSSAGLEATS